MTAILPAMPTPAAGDDRVRAELRVLHHTADVAGELLDALDTGGKPSRLPADIRARLHLLRLRLRDVERVRVDGPRPLLPTSRPDTVTLDLWRFWRSVQSWSAPESGLLGWCYLLCAHDPATGTPRPYRSPCGRGVAGHYYGWTTDLVRRVLVEHPDSAFKGPGRLVRVWLEAGLTFELTQVWPLASRSDERRLKNRGGAGRYCPIHLGTGGPLDPAAVIAAFAGITARLTETASPAPAAAITRSTTLPAGLGGCRGVVGGRGAAR